MTTASGPGALGSSEPFLRWGRLDRAGLGRKIGISALDKLSLKGL